MIDIGEEIINLENRMPISILDVVYDIREMYYKKLKTKFTPKSRKDVGL